MNELPEALRLLRDEADRFLVAADESEERGRPERMRDEARSAARRYHRIAQSRMFVDPAVAAEHFRLAAIAYRRGKSHARAGHVSGLAEWSAGHASRGTLPRLGEELEHG